MKLHKKHSSYQGLTLETLGFSKNGKADSTMPVLANCREIHAAAMPHEAGVTSLSSYFGKQILARHNYVGVDTETMVAKKSEGSGDPGANLGQRSGRILLRAHTCWVRRILRDIYFV